MSQMEITYTATLTSDIYRRHTNTQETKVYGSTFYSCETQLLKHMFVLAYQFVLL